MSVTETAGTRGSTRARLRRQDYRFAPAEPRTWSERLDHYFDELVEQSGLETTPGVLLAACLAVAALCAGAMFVWQESVAAAVLGLAFGLAATVGAIIAARAWRFRRITRQLPDVVDRLARAVRAGHSLEQSIALAAGEIDEPLASEFARVAKRLDLGLPLHAALQELTRRLPLTGVRILVAALTIHRQVGGNIVATLDQLARTIREREEYRRRFLAATAGSRMSVAFLIAIGPAVLALQTFRDPQYMAAFTSTGLGQTLLATAVLLQVLGSIWIWTIFKAGITKAEL